MNPHRARKPVDEFDDNPIKYPSQLPPKSDGKAPHVIIVGAGLGGLFLAILLDKAGIPYEIYERAATVKPLGSIMSLNCNILPAIEQIPGLLDELKAISFPGEKAEIMYDDMEISASFGSIDKDGEIGYEFLNFPRPKFYQLLLSRVPAEKIHYNKKVMSMMQNKEGVMICCADGTTYHGDILVGADGAHSAVRKDLYQTLQQQNLLPASDATEMSKGFLAMNQASTFSQVIGRGTSFNWAEFNMPENRVCWVVISQIASIAEFEKIKFHNSEWGPESNPEFIDQVKDFRVPGADTIGNLIKATPEASMCKVLLEEKLFETWSHGRTVLIGDAAHKLLPSAGQGALDGDTIHAAFLDYKEQRYHHVAEMNAKSRMNATILYGQTMTERVIRHVLLKWFPESLKQKEIRRGAAYRPMVAFLPPTPKRGKIDLLPQKPSARYTREQKEKQEEEALKSQTATEDTSADIASPVEAI